jgi:hypothetical protein
MLWRSDTSYNQSFFWRISGLKAIIVKEHGVGVAMFSGLYLSFIIDFIAVLLPIYFMIYN